VKCYIWGTALYGAKTSTLVKVHRKYWGSSETWCWRGIEVKWSDRVRNEEVLCTVKGERKVLHTIKKEEILIFADRVSVYNLSN